MDQFVFFRLCFVKKSQQCKKPLQCKLKSVEFTSLRSDISQFPNSDVRNKMVLTNKQKAVIENDFNEKGWSTYKIWKKHPSFKFSRMVVHNLIKKIKETGSTEHRKGSGQSVTTTTEENASIFEELVSSQEDAPGTHNSIRQSHLGYQSSVHRLVKKKNLHCCKRKNTPYEFSVP